MIKLSSVCRLSSVICRLSSVCKEFLPKCKHNIITLFILYAIWFNSSIANNILYGIWYYMLNIAKYCATEYGNIQVKNIL